jgi:cell wall assembly regulator SMI1
LSDEPIDVAAAWARIERWFATHLPDRALRLRPPASEAAIAEAEEQLGRRLPADLRASYRVHDGQDDHGYDVLWLPHAYRIGSLAAVVAHHRDERAFQGGVVDEERLDWLGPDGCVRQVFWHPGSAGVRGQPALGLRPDAAGLRPGPERHGGAAGRALGRGVRPAVQQLRRLPAAVRGRPSSRGGSSRGRRWPGPGDWVSMEYRSPRKVKRIWATDFFR